MISHFQNPPAGASKWIVLIERPNCAHALRLSSIWMAGSLSFKTVCGI